MAFSILTRILPKRLRSEDMATLSCLYDRGCLLSIENTPAVLDTTRTATFQCETLKSWECAWGQGYDAVLYKGDGHGFQCFNLQT